MTKIIFSYILMIYFRFFLFCSRLFWHIFQKERITIEIIEFIFSIHFDLFIKRNALRSKQLLDDLFQTFLILFLSLLWKKCIMTECQFAQHSFSFFDIFDLRLSILLWKTDLRSKSRLSQLLKLRSHFFDRFDRMRFMIENIVDKNTHLWQMTKNQRIWLRDQKI